MFDIYLCEKKNASLIDTDAYSELNEASKMELFGNIVSTLKPLIILGNVPY